MKKHYLLPVVLLAVLFLSCNDNHKLRVVTLGISHESNTFSTVFARESEFIVARGTDVLKGQQWAEYLKNEGVEIIPALHAGGWPGGVVEKSAYEHFRKEILDGIKNAGKVDGVYMDMHGALHVEGYDDAQASLIREIREMVGRDVIISGSFDLHGNLSDEFVSQIDIVTAYRTAPHRDAAETKLRAVTLLCEALKNNLKPSVEEITIPILVPGEKSITEVLPLKDIYSKLPEISKAEGIMDASIFAGYCWADLPRSAMRVFVVARNKKFSSRAKDYAINLAQQIWDSREKMVLDVPSGSIDEMIDKSSESVNKTVFISDSGDNTTAGAPGDNTQVLAALLSHGCKNALIAGIVDNDALNECIKTGIGKSTRIKLGGKVDTTFCKPLEINARVIFLSPDTIMKTDRALAVVETEGVKTVILKSRRSFTEKRDFREAGLNPMDFSIVVVKLGYLFPELRDIARVHLMALTTGFCNLDIASLPYKRVHRPSYPVDKDMVWSAKD
jgi:microcystin degradation protein MlrC